VSEARSHQAPWEDNAHARFRWTDNGLADEISREVTIRRSGSGVVKRSILRSSRAEPRIRVAPTSRKRRKRCREHTGCGYTQFVWVADVDRTHRAS